MVTNRLATISKATRDKQFITAIYYKKKMALLAGETDQYDAGTPFKCSIISDEHKLQYHSSHIRIDSNDVVIETWTPLSLIHKSKVLIENRTLQVKQFYPVREVKNAMNSNEKWVITLG